MFVIAVNSRTITHYKEPIARSNTRLIRLQQVLLQYNYTLYGEFGRDAIRVLIY